MSKFSQLERLRQHRLPVPAFVGVSYADVQAGKLEALVSELSFPVAVRSTFSREDGSEKSYAGAFHTELQVSREALAKAVEKVFASYPSTEGESVLIQEMVQPTYSGVLFAFRDRVWKMEYIDGLGEELVSGKKTPDTLLLPRFSPADKRWSRWFSIWQPFGKQAQKHPLIRPFIHLSVYTGAILDDLTGEAPHGVDIEFCVADGKLYLLQVRPITTPEEGEEILTSANHREILPAFPSQLMTDLISSCRYHLFAYYQRLDPTLTARSFIEVSAGMPWINLSALLDTMVHWGLPTSLVCDSVGAEDFYQVRPRPYRILRKFPVFFRVLKEQIWVVTRTRRWVKKTQQSLAQEIQQRSIFWEQEPAIAFHNWFTNLQLIYVNLVSLMQALTGAMSGPVKLVEKLGLLARVQATSESTLYLEAYKNLLAGKGAVADFVATYGHRGFYESDIGQTRFAEFQATDWEKLLGNPPAEARSKSLSIGLNRFWGILLYPMIRLIHSREWLRSESMRFFLLLRQEIQAAMHLKEGDALDFSAYRSEELEAFFSGHLTPDTLRQIAYPPQSGWDMDTFLWNTLDRRLPMQVLANLKAGAESSQGLGIYPGKVKGQIWRVDAAALGSLAKPDFPVTILLTDSLDPGWVPYFVQVDAVLSRVGGILSHASIILRESRIPSVTRMPRHLEFETGDWVEMDGRSGEVKASTPPKTL
ncbi:MAG: PEP/pyruvate-binding domain-containing protein [Bacteroidota bacterium]